MRQFDNATADLHNALYKSGVEILDPFIRELTSGQVDHNLKATAEERLATVKRGVDILERVVSMNPRNWSALWTMGMAWSAVNHPEDAYNAFKRAYRVNPDHADVARELGGACIKLGRGEEAVTVTQRAMMLMPTDAGLVANYAYALLVHGDVEAASEQVKRALKMDPSDQVTKNLAAAIAKRLERDRPRE